MERHLSLEAAARRKAAHPLLAQGLIIPVSFILVITYLAFLPSLNNGFVNWDDPAYLQNNYLIQDFSWRGLWRIFTSFHAGLYKPLVLVSFAAEYYLFGLEPFFYHLHNLLLHLLNCLLVYLFIYLLSKNRAVSLLTALFFGIHPLRVESVAWIAERKDVLSAFFFLLSLIAYLLYSEIRRRRHYYFSLAAYLACLLAKPSGVAFPFVLLAIDFFKQPPLIPFAEIPGASARGWKIAKVVISATGMNLLTLVRGDSIRRHNQQGHPSSPQPCQAGSADKPVMKVADGAVKADMPSTGRGLWSTLLREKLPFIALSLLAVALNIYAQQESFSKMGYLIEMDANSVLTPIERVLVAAHGVVFYLKKLLLPLRLSCLYPFPLRENGLLTGEFLYSPVILLFLVLLLLRLRHQHKVVFGAAFFLINISAVLQFFPTGPFFAADRYSYIPSIGVFYIFSEGFFAVFSRVRRPSKIMLACCLMLLVGTNIFLTRRRIKVFQDSLSLWDDCLENYPNSALAYNNRGDAYQQLGRLPEAVYDYNTAIEINPGFALAYNNRGRTRRLKGQLDLAMADFSQAIKLIPDYAVAYYNRGLVLLLKGELNQALCDFNQAIKIEPRFAAAYNSRGVAYARRHELDKALADFAAALQYDPDYLPARRNHEIISSQQAPRRLNLKE